MPKNFLRDVLPKKTVREVSVLSGRNSGVADDPETIIYRGGDVPPVIEYDVKPRKWRLWIVAGVAFVVLVIAISTIFTSATVSVTEKTQTSDIDVRFTAKTKPSIGIPTFEITTLSKTGSVEVEADGEKMTERKSSGTIVIYNNFSSASQRLVKNTRFQTPEGLIYRIDRSVVVPGKKEVSGQSVPGSLEATVFADSAGPDYNIGLTDFTVPGFKSSAARYANFYARSKTPMTGGFSGISKYVSDQKLKAATDTLKADLEKQAVAEFKSSLPQGFVLPEGAYSTAFETIPSTDGSTAKKSVTVSGKATVTAFLFKKSDLDDYLAVLGLKDKTLQVGSVRTETMDGLKFVMSPLPKDGAAEPSEATFSVKGSVKFIWNFDENKLKIDLAGKPKSSLPAILRDYPGIVKAEVSIMPFWTTRLPSDASKLKIVKAK